MPLSDLSKSALKDRIAVLRRDLADAQEEKTILKAKSDDAKARLDKAQAVVDSIKASIQSLQGDIDEDGQ